MDKKSANFEVRPFKFGQLDPNAGKEPNSDIESVSEFELRSLKDASAFRSNISDDVIRKERDFESKSNFSILPLVREHRGLKEQEESEARDAIEAEVQKRVAATIEEARAQGHREGHQEGYQSAYQEALTRFDEKIEDFSDILGQLKDQCHKVLSDNKQDAYKMVKSLTQWVTLKEVQDEEYLQRLLEKLILEMNTKTNLVARVSQESFKRMPEVVERVEKKLGQLTNIRVEMDLDQEGPGIILESGNGIIDGSIKAQMASLDRIFESVTKDE